jgi:hypothetical protein
MNENLIPHLLQEYERQKALFENQPTIVQRFLESQAQIIAEALITKTSRVHFSLPDRVVTHIEQIKHEGTITIPEAQRKTSVGGFLQRNVHDLLKQRLNELEKSADQAISIGAGLLRYATAIHLIHNSLPAGRNVTYRPNEDEDIPTIPVDDSTMESAITQASDAIAEEGNDASRGEVQTPFVPAARKFFLPQWVAFDDQGKLLVGSLKEAEAHVASMQRYAMILHRALSLAPYISASGEYQRKRYGILGQMINQGRALANFRTQEIIAEIKRRAEKQNLNRGLSISLPYFDDQLLTLEVSNMEVIPAGRIMFVPAFVVRATQGEQVKIAQDTRLNASTRRHLLNQLKSLEMAFRS